jgi:hypothetical protein
MRKTPLLIAAAVALALPASAAAALPAPRLVAPVNGARVQELPAISWSAVRGAAEYEYEISADRHFSSIIGSGPGKGTNRTYNLAAALDRVMANGTYWWRVRALSASGASGAWSRARRIVKRWTYAPQILQGDGANVTWPTTPLVLSWSKVPYAAKYMVTVANDPALANVVLGSVSQPQYTDATSFVLPGTLATGTYYWAVTPVDAEGHRGMRSRVASFTWTWPTSTAASFTDLDPQIFDPFFSWTPVPGAARYEVEINQSPAFAGGSKWCCSSPTIGSSLAPLQNLANNSTYWWRMRALDPNGNAGQWNDGGSFTKVFDPATPSIPNLRVVDATGTPLTGTAPVTDTPIVTWDPVPGAARYEVTLASYSTYCNWGAGALYHAQTAGTAWTPLGITLSRPGPTAWPLPQTDFQPLTAPQSGHPPEQVCVRVTARADDDAQHQQVISQPSYANPTNDPNLPAFSFAPQPTSVMGQPFSWNVTSATEYNSGSALTPCDLGPNGCRLPPLLTWSWLPGANGYFVVIARDPGFTDVADVAFTKIPAYAPRLGNYQPLADKTTAYYWAVIPAQCPTGLLLCNYNDAVQSDVFGAGSQQVPQFNKYSDPPTPLQPANGANVSTWPTFSWTSALNARNYTLQVSQDPTFGNPIDNVTTDGTAYTSSSTYPANALMYWRIRGNDWTGQGLNWSPVQTFTRRLPASSPAVGNPFSGDGEPVLRWTGVPGAIGYDVHIDEGNGFPTDTTVDSTAFAPIKRQGLGTIFWQVRPLFPTTSFTTVGGGFFGPQPYVLTLSPPRGARARKGGGRFVISWSPDPAATRYEVEVARSDSFSIMTIVEQHMVDGTSWAPDIDPRLPGNRHRLYWRVAAVDAMNTVGSFAAGHVG